MGVILDCKLGFRFEAASVAGMGEVKEGVLCRASTTCSSVFMF